MPKYYPSAEPEPKDSLSVNQKHGHFEKLIFGGIFLIIIFTLAFGFLGVFYKQKSSLPNGQKNLTPGEEASIKERLLSGSEVGTGVQIEEKRNTFDHSNISPADLKDINARLKAETGGPEDRP